MESPKATKAIVGAGAMTSTRASRNQAFARPATGNAAAPE
jgi:hypothetical protein